MTKIIDMRLVFKIKSRLALLKKKLQEIDEEDNEEYCDIAASSANKGLLQMNENQLNFVLNCINYEIAIIERFGDAIKENKKIGFF